MCIGESFCCCFCCCVHRCVASQLFAEFGNPKIESGDFEHRRFFKIKAKSSILPPLIRSLVMCARERPSCLRWCVFCSSLSVWGGARDGHAYRAGSVRALAAGVRRESWLCACGALWGLVVSHTARRVDWKTPGRD